MGHGSHGSGIVAGLSHPIFGTDHLMAIFAMALYTKINFRDRAWPIIFSFVAAMVIGGIIGINAQAFAIEEPIIMGSVIAYGALVGLGIKIPQKVYIGLGVVIGFFHGHAHGVEMPDSTTPIQYVPGFAIGALIISAFGEYVGRHIGSDNVKTAHFIGGLIAGAGTIALFA